jgi:hypothetical protein
MASERKASWPYHSDAELTVAGYKFDNRSRFKGATCGAEIEWWWTPNNRLIPLDAGTMQPHFATCPDVAEFRKR